MPRDIRDLAQRAELDFQRRPHRFRRRAWWAGLVMALGCCGWMLASSIIGEHRVYDAGPLSTDHAFIANDCRQCHLTWQPARRLVGGDIHSSSISNASCTKCHTAPEHHKHQVPAHAQLSCAECHREHQGRMKLAQVSDKNCIRCHADLKRDDHQPTLFARHITGFDESLGHPEYNLQRRLKQANEPSNLLTQVELNDLLKSDPDEAKFQHRFLDVLRPSNMDSQTSQLRDRGEIKFNHQVHLDPQRMRDKSGKQVDLSQNCQACHVPDLAGRYMLPIQFEQHCAQCHPLWFDNQHYAGIEVPHERPDVVRGFLTEKYTLSVLKNEKPLEQVQRQEPEFDRSLPGPSVREPLVKDQARQLEQLVQQAERMVQDHGRMAKSQGGCKLCHSIETSATGDWSITPPNIPNRWLPHSRFEHKAHRMLNCAACHAKVAEKKDTADVMLPTIAECRQCHVSGSPRPTGIFDPQYLTNVAASPIPTHSLTSSCVMCHTYHRKP